MTHTGNCIEWLATLEAKSVDHVITDPPYTDRTSKGARKCNRGETLEKTRAFITFDGVDGLEAKIVDECLRVSRRWIVIFCALEQIGTYARAAGDRFIRSTVWIRTNSAPQFTGDRPGQMAEGCVILHRKGRKRWNRGGCGLSWHGPTANSTGDAQRGTLKHPTPKPEWLMLDVVDAFTDPGDLVIDPFAGSGTTGVACLRRGRRFLGCEINPEYAARANERLTAELEGSTIQAREAGQLALLGGTR